MKSLIAGNIKTILDKKGYKQKAIAARAGYDEKVFSAMLRGRKCIYDYDVAILAKALEVSPNELFKQQ